jgi:hypothetical protein
MRQQLWNDCIVTVTALPGSCRADVRIAGEARDCMPRNSTLVVSRVSAATRRVLAAAGMWEVLTTSEQFATANQMDRR